MTMHVEGSEGGNIAQRHSVSEADRHTKYEKVRAAFENAEPVYIDGPESTADGRLSEAGGQGAQTIDSKTIEGKPLAGRGARPMQPESHGVCDQRQDRDKILVNPIIPLGHKDGAYSFISASGELRTMKAEALEAGRGVRALFSGVSQEAEAWCQKKFSTGSGDWSPKDVGQWIIKSCNASGMFDRSSADIRSIGVWRDSQESAVAHCGDKVVDPDGHASPLAEHRGKHIMKGAAPIAAPAEQPATPVEMADLLERLKTGWGWKRACDADIFFGWVTAAFLGGFPEWRAHLYVHGTRGSGKSKLMELAAKLLGDLAGCVVNDATEAGLRQSRNDQARPVLIDEFEPDENARNGSRQDGMLALFRRMSGGQGGRISRGGADHSSVSFRALGAAYVTSINHIYLEPQDRSRFVMLELGNLPDVRSPAQTAAALCNVETCAKDLATRAFRRMLSQSRRWDSTHAMIAAEARRYGADARQADTAATILTGRDLGLFDEVLSGPRLCEIGPILQEMLVDASEADVASEGAEALDFLLNSELHLDHGIRRSVANLLDSVITDTPIVEVGDPESALARHGVYVLKQRNSIAIRLGKTTPSARLFKDTKWRNGAHVSALLKVDGAQKPSSGVRLPRASQQRVIVIPFECLPFADSHIVE